MSGPVLVGLGLAAVGLIGRQLTKQMKGKQIQDLIKIAGFTTSKYYKGGFDKKMSRREAALILGIPQSSSKTKIREAHKRIMLINHPDRGGSPYLAAKINEAKDYLENDK